MEAQETTITTMTGAMTHTGHHLWDNLTTHLIRTTILTHKVDKPTPRAITFRRPQTPITTSLAVTSSLNQSMRTHPTTPPSMLVSQLHNNPTIISMLVTASNTLRMHMWAINDMLATLTPTVGGEAEILRM